MDGSKFESDMSKENEKIIMAVFSITFAMLWILFFIQMAALKECNHVHDRQNEIIDNQSAFIVSLIMRNEVLWEKVICRDK